jgi:hypothetical protein
MSRVAIVEYLSYVDNNGLALGHGKKALQEAYDLLKDNFEVECFCSRAYTPLMDKADSRYCNLKSLVFSSQDQHKVHHYRTGLENVRKVLHTDCEYIWFVNIEWSIFLYLLILPHKNKKVIVTMYRDIKSQVLQNVTRYSDLKNRFITKGISVINLIIVTNNNLTIADNQIFIPDFLYDDNYIKFRNCNKKERVACVGEMRSGKDILGLVRKFVNTDIPLLVEGFFFDKELYNYLLSIKTNNIVIEDRNIPYEQYLQLLAESRFVILPYDMKSYQGATSGILLESVFCNSVPIAPKELLQFNNISGIGYQELEELPDNYADFLRMSEDCYNDTSAYDKKLAIEKIKNAILNLSK